MKEKIIDYLNREFNTEYKPNELKGNIPLAYTTTPNDEHEINFFINLEKMTWWQTVNKVTIDQGPISDDFFDFMSFDDYTMVEEEKLQKALNLTIDEEGNFV